MKFRLITALVFGLVLSLSLLLALTHSPAYAAGITVTTDADSDADDGDCTLREAIEAANTDTAYNGCSAGSGADTITFADDYTITLNGNQLTVITSTIAIIGNGPANTILQANAAPDTATYRVFEVGSAGNLTLDNVTVRHGRCDGACPTQVNNGSGIYNAGTLAVSNSSIISNTSSVNGGGIFNIGILTVTSSLFSHNQGSAIHADWKGQSTVISDTQIVHNRDNSDGGGIDADHPLTVTNSFIGYNIASGGDGGGGLQSGEDVHVLIENSEIVSNTATVEEGGGLYLYRGWATIRNSRIVSNTTYRYGGGIYVDDASTNGMLSIENSEIAYNRVFTDSVGGPADGGGIYINNNPHVKIEDVFIHHNEASRDGGGLWLDDRLVLTMTGSTIAHNAAYNGRGGGIFAETQSLTAENSTISHNQSQHGGGIYAYEGGSEVLITLTHVSLISNTATISGGGLYLDDGSNTGPIVRTTLQNSLITSNAGGDCARLEGWEEIDATPGYNLDSDGTCVTDGVDNNLTSATPGVGPLADNDGYALSDGTVIPTHALLTGSPAIDIIPIGNCVLSEDQRGVSRPQSAGCDIGAYESLAPELTVTKGGDGFGAVTSSPPGIDCGPDCAETYDFGTVVTLTASAETGSNFAGWSGDVVSSDNPLAVTMDGSKAITATFAQNQYTLDVTTVGSGSVSKQPDQATYTHGTVVTLTASADTGWTFSGWSGDASGTDNTLAVTMDGSKAITATFAQNQYTLDVTTVGSGSVGKQPDQATYAHGTVVTLTASADTGWTFSGWSGDVTSSDNPLAVTMDGSKAITATFTEEGTQEGGSVQGTVVDENDNGIPNVQVTLSNEAAVSAALVLTDTTESDGSYGFDNVPAGAYTLTFAAEGYVSPEPVTVEVAEGEAKTVEPVVLQVDAGSGDTFVYLPAVQSASVVQASGESVRRAAMEKGLYLPAIVR